MKKLLTITALFILTTVNSQSIYNWQALTDPDKYEIQHDVNSNNIFISDITIYPDMRLVLNSDSIIFGIDTITHWTIANGRAAFNWGNHSSAGYLTTSSTNTLTNKSGNISQWTNNSGYLTSFTEVDGSTTNEIELPTQTSNSGKVLSTNGSAPSWIAVPNEITTYNAAGTISVTKRWIATVTPSTGNGYSIDISSAGFSNVLGVSMIPIKNTSLATSSPKVSIKTVSTTAIVVNIIEGNATLSLGLLLGVSEQFVNTSGLTMMVVVEGN